MTREAIPASRNLTGRGALTPANHAAVRSAEVAAGSILRRRGASAKDAQDL